ncbi:DNA polymerase III subunit gamma and tau [Pseudokineococcus lusitanus]|uniref:DNA-directed DNA polymerase n=1 Tax=Pseudokineococcus lusitanus TaxID=763993 RepID=A0A3N1HQF0_9ACTN|nr:DNA polymerase III subunit gamma and tau [Pseudokineococcus lusitanus]ROP44612.1 DNA polymerase-3 subunit gamma/tau [Pseudokineococcus lusitanus]
MAAGGRGGDGPTLALYRRYRPESFEDVIGQEHVTAPLMQALRTGRVNHAYLFSGPRGCGKTTSARILARCLNCTGPDGQRQTPTDTPCGQCPSCVELARGGSGSLDVLEIDAASHGGVDDARELRERATFAPARDRYKVFVVDEAHMVTSQGFNALLKLVEEPPEHVVFVFATTEPDKVLGTIRSRTHHYPFRLVPPEVLLGYLEHLAEVEGVPVGKGVLPLVVRAGAGSVRDSLSVLDQLVAGADEGGVDYERAISLLGYTHGSLLDDVVDALAAGDGGSVFRVVDRVVGSGHDPRRFVEDLLERLRDLVVVRATGEGARAVLRTVPEDQLARMQGQAQLLGLAELSRAADVANAALTEMTGATSPRLHLELLCARLLLPVADVGERGLGARVDRLERRLGVPVTGPTGTAAAPLAPSPAPAAAAPAPAPDEAAVEAPRRRVVPAPAEEPVAAAAPAATSPAAPAPSAPAPSAPAEAPAPAPTRPAPTASSAGGDVDTVRRMWPDVLERVGTLRRATWSLVSQHVQVHEVTGGAVRLALPSEGLARTFASGPHADVVRRALVDVLGLDLPVEVATPGAPPAAPPSSAGASGSRPVGRDGGPRGGGSSGDGGRSRGDAGGTDGGRPPSATRPGGAPTGAPSSSDGRGAQRPPAGGGRGSSAPASTPPAARSAAPASAPAAGEDDWPEPARPGAGRQATAAPTTSASASAPAATPAAAPVPPSPAPAAGEDDPPAAGGRRAPEPASADGTPDRGAPARAQGGTGRAPARGGASRGQAARGSSSRGAARGGRPLPPTDWDDLPPAEPPDDDAPPEDGPPPDLHAPRGAVAPSAPPAAARPQGHAGERAAAPPQEQQQAPTPDRDEPSPRPTTPTPVAEAPAVREPVAVAPVGPSADAGAPGGPRAGGPPLAPEPTAPTPPRLTGAAAARAAAAASRSRLATSAEPAAPAAAGDVVEDPDDAPSRDDADAEDESLVGARLVEQVLGGRVIDEG